MSLNLYLQVDDVEVNLLRQTPTYITKMCLMDQHCFKYLVKGNEAIRALRCYNEWYVDAMLGGAWDNEEELQSAKEDVMSHVEEVNAYIKSGKELVVFAQ